jgi:hypothetical protein
MTNHAAHLEQIRPIVRSLAEHGQVRLALRLVHLEYKHIMLSRKKRITDMKIDRLMDKFDRKHDDWTVARFKIHMDIEEALAKME